jgi:hypothetical protein
MEIFWPEHSLHIWPWGNICRGVTSQVGIPCSPLIARGFLVGKNLFHSLHHEIFIRKVKCHILGGSSEDRWVNLNIEDCNELMPIGTFEVMFIVVLRLWQRCMGGLGCKQIPIHPGNMTTKELRDGFEIIRCARHDLSDLLDHEVITGILSESPLLSSSIAEPLKPRLASYF